jgi:hypothetical protein
MSDRVFRSPDGAKRNPGQAEALPLYSRIALRSIRATDRFLQKFEA